MSKKRNDDLKNRVVFSTNPDYKPETEGQTEVTLSPSQQTLYVSLERIKGGKVATIIENFIGNQQELEALGKQLKTNCGVGGTVKNGIILIQGEQREKILQLLSGMGYKTKRKGG
jgi:translation initiation factor 1